MQIYLVSFMNLYIVSQEKIRKSQGWVNIGIFLVNGQIPKKIPNLVKSSHPNFSSSWEFNLPKFSQDEKFSFAKKIPK